MKLWGLWLVVRDHKNAGSALLILVPTLAVKQPLSLILCHLFPIPSPFWYHEIMLVNSTICFFCSCCCSSYLLLLFHHNVHNMNLITRTLEVMDRGDKSKTQTLLYTVISILWYAHCNICTVIHTLWYMHCNIHTVM